MNEEELKGLWVYYYGRKNLSKLKIIYKIKEGNYLIGSDYDFLLIEKEADTEFTNVTRISLFNSGLISEIERFDYYIKISDDGEVTYSTTNPPMAYSLCLVGPIENNSGIATYIKFNAKTKHTLIEYFNHQYNVKEDEYGNKKGRIYDYVLERTPIRVAQYRRKLSLNNPITKHYITFINYDYSLFDGNDSDFIYGEIFRKTIIINDRKYGLNTIKTYDDIKEDMEEIGEDLKVPKKIIYIYNKTDKDLIYHQNLIDEIMEVLKQEETREADVITLKKELN